MGIERAFPTDGILDTQTIQLRLSEAAPHGWLVDFDSIIQTAIDTGDVVYQDVDSESVFVVLLVDGEGFLVQAMFDSNSCDLLGVITVELVDVVNYLALVRSNGRKKEEILQVAVVTEGGWLQNDLLEHFDEFKWQVGLHEGFDGAGDIIGVGAFRDCGGSNLRNRKGYREQSKTAPAYVTADLVDQGSTVQVISNQDLLPQLHAATFDKISSLLLEHRVLVRNADEFVVAEALCVSDVGQVGVALLAILADYKRFVDL